MKKIIVLFLSLCLWTSVIAQVSVTTTSTSAICFGLCNGTATANPGGGSPPYAYYWGSTPPQITQTATGLCAGTYSVTVTDNLGITGTASVTINQPSQVNVTLNVTNDCGGVCNGWISAVATGGSAPYMFLWSNSTTSSWNVNLCAGTYSITIADANNCTATQTTVVSSNTNTITDMVIETDPSFCGNAVGAAWISSVTGGSPPYLYQWSTGAIGQAHNSMVTGTYQVTVTDNNNCNYSESVVILDSLGFDIVLDSISPANCANNQMGYIGLSIAGGQGPFGIIWTPGGMNTLVIDNLQPGNYYVSILDSTSWCIIQRTYTIQNTYNLYASVITNPANCNSNGSATVTAQGIHPPFTYLWDDTLAQTDSTAESLAGGQYHVTITDAIGCTVVAEANIESDCSIIIRGTVYVDSDLDCVKDSSETGYHGAIVQSLYDGYTFTDANGNYTLTATLDPSYISVAGINNILHVSCPMNNETIIQTALLGDTVNDVDFALTMDSTLFDLSVSPWYNAARPGFAKYYQPCIRYYGTNIIDVALYMEYDPVLLYTSCTMGGIHDALNHTITWTINNLVPVFNGYWNALYPVANFTVPAGTPIGDTLFTYFELLPMTGDINPSNNTRSLIEVVTGSYDPNDKQVNPPGEGATGCLLPEDSILNYQIRFQNTGTDTAFTVIVVDTLPPYVNPATFEMGGTSHPCTVSMRDDGILFFRFDQILLPDSNVSQGGSNGFITYSVHADPGLAWNTVIENSAAIYFDFNAAVITNTVINTLCEPVAAPDNRLLTVSIFPNPAKSIVTFSANEEIQYVCLFDICGKKVMEKNSSGTGVFNLSLPDNLKGVYLYEIRTKDKTAFGKVVVE